MRSGSVTSTGSEATEGPDTPFANGARWRKSIKLGVRRLVNGRVNFPLRVSTAAETRLSPRRVELLLALKLRHRMPSPPSSPSFVPCFSRFSAAAHPQRGHL